MSDGWAAGDLALCIKQGPWEFTYDDGHVEACDGPECGSILTVSRINIAWDASVCLFFKEWQLDFCDDGFNASRFRKIPPHQPDAEDAETIRLLTGKPILEPINRAPDAPCSVSAAPPRSGDHSDVSQTSAVSGFSSTEAR